MIYAYFIACLWFGCPEPPPPSPPETHISDVTAPESDISEYSAPVYRGMGNQTTDVEQWRSLAVAYFPGEVELALCVVTHESGGNPNALNQKGSGARGLWQVKDWWAPSFGGTASMLYEPGFNAWVASEIRRIQGWEAWSVYNDGKC